MIRPLNLPPPPPFFFPPIVRFSWVKVEREQQRQLSSSTRITCSFSLSLSLTQLSSLGLAAFLASETPANYIRFPETGICEKRRRQSEPHERASLKPVWYILTLKRKSNGIVNTTKSFSSCIVSTFEYLTLKLG